MEEEHMKTKLPPPPVTDPSDLMPPTKSLKAYFIGCALHGCIASQEEAVPVYTDKDLVERAYRLGETMFALYTQENPSVIRKFNQKVGL
jgi:hypothetical protein